MKDPWNLSDEAERESYRHFDRLVRNLPKSDDGSLNLNGVSLHGNDIDAFRHAYVSGVFLHEYGENGAKLAGWLNEKLNFQSQPQPGDENMDFWNNAVGIELAKKHRNRDDLAKAIKEALDKGELIISVKDERRYEGVQINVDDSGVVVIKECSTGANELFFDTKSASTLTRSEFVAAIEAGRYPTYGVRTINGVQYPVSKRDGEENNNLG